MNLRRSRLAPSPTGALHLGNACSFLINWALARSKNWELILRMEDLVGPRIDSDSIKETILILKWLGVEWDSEPILQSNELEPYLDGLDKLIAGSHVYHCNLSRKEIDQAASAPHADDPFGRESIRPSNVQLHNSSWNNEATNWRFIVPTKKHCVQDELLGEQTFERLNDFVVWTKNNMPAYQLAVVIDDARQGITDVVRGNDLLESTAWQLQLYSAFAFPPPKWWHLPLVVGEDGRRLAKRHGDTRLLTYRNSGTSPERIVGLVAKWCGIVDDYTTLSSVEFCDRFDISTISHEDIVFSKEDDQWLVG
ncbi:MAG: glutamate--tRNA ligase family protein [Phycisphaerales bacterium]|nr:glutamate--tRNA ligase family protein [Phycisphaerales bacterium]